MSAEPRSLLAVGLNHTTAPVEIRERLALSDDDLRRELQALRDDGICREALLVSTCNRVELYAVPFPGTEAALTAWFQNLRGTNRDPIDRYLYWHRGRDAVVHLFRVAASLDSLVVGEPQILGQVKDAVRIAGETRSLGRVLQKLADRSLSVAKKVRTETDIGRHRVGIGNAGVDLALQIFGDLEDKRAMLVGVGEMGRQVARALVNEGLEELLVANRTYERAVEEAGAHGGTAIQLDRVGEYLDRVDVVITASGAVTHVITYDDVRRAMRRRRYKPLFLVDLAVPRNIDPRIDRLDEAFLFNIDDLIQVVEQGKRARAEATDAASRLVEAEADRFLEALAEIDVGPRIGGLTRRVESIRQAELARSTRLVEGLDDDQRKQLDALTRALLKKVLHGPVTAVRDAARRGAAEEVDMLLGVWEEEDE